MVNEQMRPHDSVDEAGGPLMMVTDPDRPPPRPVSWSILGCAAAVLFGVPLCIILVWYWTDVGL